MVNELQDLNTRSFQHNLRLYRAQGYLREGRIAEATHLLSDLQYIGQYIANVPGGVYSLLSIYEQISPPLDQSLQACRGFLQEHAQRLDDNRSLLYFSLVSHEGPEVLQSQIQNAIDRGYSHPWINTTKVLLNPVKVSSRVSSNFGVVSEYDFGGSPIHKITGDGRFVIYMSKKGQFKIIDLINSRELENPIVVFQGRILTLEFSPDRTWLALMYEDGQLRLYHLEYSHESQEVNRSPELVGTFPYYLPEYNDPVIFYSHEKFWYQDTTQAIHGISIRTNLSHIIGKKLNGELNGGAALNDLLLVTLRGKSDTHLMLLDQFFNEIMDQKYSISLAYVKSIRSDMILLRSIHGNDVFLTMRDSGNLEQVTPNLTTIEKTLAYNKYAVHFGNKLSVIEGTKARLYGTIEVDHQASYNIIDFFWGGNRTEYWSVVQYPDGSFWLLDGEKQNEKLIRDDSQSYLFGVNDHYRFLAAKFPYGIYFGLREPLAWYQQIETPIVVKSILGGPTDTFWISDAYGEIYILATNSFTKVEKPNVNIVQHLQWIQTENGLIWFGTCIYGSDMFYFMAYYQCHSDDPFTLKYVGKRLFDLKMGMYCACGYNPLNGHLFVVFKSIKSGIRTTFQDHLSENYLYVGTLEMFLTNTESYFRLDERINRDINEIRVDSDGSSLWILDEAGSLYNISLDSYALQVILQPSRPFVKFSKSPFMVAPLAVINNQNEVFVCEIVKGNHHDRI